MIELFSNPWVVSIVGGLTSASIVGILSRHFFSRRKDREAIRRTVEANREVLYSIRQLIPDNALPDKRTLFSLIKATARRHQTEPSRMLTTEEILEELIKEVMDASFISAAMKTDYCEALSKMKTEADVFGQSEGATFQARSVSSAGQIVLLSAMSGIIAFLMTAGLIQINNEEAWFIQTTLSNGDSEATVYGISNIIFLVVSGTLGALTLIYVLVIIANSLKIRKSLESRNNRSLRNKDQEGSGPISIEAIPAGEGRKAEFK